MCDSVKVTDSCVFVFVCCCGQCEQAIKFCHVRSVLEELRQWLNYSKVGGGSLHFLPSLPPSLPLPFLPIHSLPSLLEVRPLNLAMWSGGSL